MEDRNRQLAELKLYRLSPVGPALTTFIIGAVTWGTFLGIVALTEDFNAFIAADQGQSMLRLSFILTLILCAALAVNFYDEEASRRDIADLDRELGIKVPLEREVHPILTMATWGGLAGGVVFVALLVFLTADGDILAFLASIGLWFIPMTPILWMLMARGVAGSIISGGVLSKVIREELTIDLYRHHELAIFGRIAMRGAFVWLIFVGIILLFFVDNELAVFAQPTLVISLGIASYNFVATMRPIRSKIREAKEAELTLIRERLARARTEMEKGAPGAEIPALIALETRIEDIREWPMDLPTAARLPLYLLIPVVPWALGILAESQIERWMGG